MRSVLACRSTDTLMRMKGRFGRCAAEAQLETESVTRRESVEVVRLPHMLLECDLFTPFTRSSFTSPGVLPLSIYLTLPPVLIDGSKTGDQ